MSSRRSRLVLAVVTVALGLSACGTTVRTLDRTGQGLSAPRQDPGASLELGAGAASPRPGAAARGGATPHGATSRPLGPGTSIATLRTDLPLGARGHGFTATTVTLGYSTSRDLAATSRALGLSGVSTGDVDNQMRALAAEVNRHGGLLGRQLRFVAHDFSASSCNTDPASCAQSACEDWTVDHQVFAVVDGLHVAAGSPLLVECLRRAGTPVLTNAILPARAYQGPLGIYGPSSMDADRYIPAVVDRLVAMGFFTGWDTATGRPSASSPVRIGITHFDNADGRYMAKLYRDALARHGLRIAAESEHSVDLGGNASQTQADVLRFQAEGVTHMLNPNVLFYQGAESQHYYPRYEIDDTISASLMATVAPKTQLRGAMGVGFIPSLEVPDPPDATPAATRCLAIMRAAGEDTTNITARAVMLNGCDGMFLLQQALARSRELSVAGLHRGVGLLGSSYQPTLTYASGFPPRSHAGAGVVRDFVFDDERGCFVFPDHVLHRVP